MKDEELKRQIKSALELTLLVADCIREAGQVPSGHLYTMMAGKISLDEYMRVLRILKDTGMIREENHLLTWVGVPPKSAEEGGR